MLQTYRKAGYAVVSCTYPFLSDDIDHLKIARHRARAVQFVRSKAKNWNLDPARLCCCGVSAGALISEFLAYHDDFADPSAKDVISQQSSRPAVVMSMKQPIGTKQFVTPFMDKGEAPIFIYSDAKPSDRIHPPWAAIMLRDKAQELGIPCVACAAPIQPQTGLVKWYIQTDVSADPLSVRTDAKAGRTRWS